MGSREICYQIQYKIWHFLLVIREFRMVAERYRKVPRPLGQKLQQQQRPLRLPQQLLQSIPRLDLGDSQALDWPRGRGKGVSPKDPSGADWGARTLVVKLAALRVHRVNKAQERVLQISKPRGIPACSGEGKCPAGISNLHLRDGHNLKANHLGSGSETPTKRGSKTCS